MLGLTTPLMSWERNIDFFIYASFSLFFPQSVLHRVEVMNSSEVSDAPALWRESTTITYLAITSFFSLFPDVYRLLPTVCYFLQPQRWYSNPSLIIAAGRYKVSTSLTQCLWSYFNIVNCLIISHAISLSLSISYTHKQTHTQTHTNTHKHTHKRTHKHTHRNIKEKRDNF